MQDMGEGRLPWQSQGFWGPGLGLRRKVFERERVCECVCVCECEHVYAHVHAYVSSPEPPYPVYVCMFL